VTAPGPRACVLGSMDLVRPLGLAGIRCVAAARPGAPPRFSRFTAARLEWSDPWRHPDVLAGTLLTFGATQPEPPVLFYEEDGDLLFISRWRETLARAFRFVVPDATLVEDLVDKERFQRLATALTLPVPGARRFDPATERPGELGLRFPVVLKPLTRRPESWDPVAGGAKALRVDTPPELAALWPRLAAAGLPLLAQELVPGAEQRIESYHAYVRPGGEVVGEFTGRKIRTWPLERGESTALELTDASDVTSLGRDVLARLRFAGVAKLDFKRDPAGRLWLLEINPRFNLWHHLGAVAGVNLPALVYADLTGAQATRRAPPRARAGARWCRPWVDWRAARATGLPLWRWAPWALACDAKSVVAWDDPLPLLGAAVCRPLRSAARAIAAGYSLEPTGRRRSPSL